MTSPVAAGAGDELGVHHPRGGGGGDGGCCGGGDPWASLSDLVVDVHTHILPESWPNLKERYGYGGWVQMVHTGDGKTARMVQDDGKPFRAVEDNCWSLDRRARDCAPVGVHVHVLSTVPVMFSYWAKPEDTLDLAVMLNDHIAQCVRRDPTRYIGLGTLPMQAPDLAVKELRRCMSIGLAGVQIGTHINHWTLDHPALFPVFQAAEEVGAAIFIHPWDMMGQSLMGKYFLPWLVGMPAETSLAICSLMFGGVFQRLPKLRVCFAHGGGAFPCTWARIQHGFDVRPDVCAVDCAVPPKDQIGRFWVDSLVHDPDCLNSIVKLFGETKVCLGTDYPFPLGEYTAESGGKEYDAGALVRSMGWPTHLRRRVMGLNALAWLGVDPAVFAAAHGRMEAVAGEATGGSVVPPMTMATAAGKAATSGSGVEVVRPDCSGCSAAAGEGVVPASPIQS